MIIYIGFAVVAIFLVILGLTKANEYSVRNLDETERKVNELYKVHMKPLCEEYRNLKGYDRFEIYSDSVYFQSLEVYGYHLREELKQPATKEVIEYSKLQDKLDQLKKDMKRGCEIYCKETNEKTP